MRAESFFLSFFLWLALFAATNSLAPLADAQSGSGIPSLTYIPGSSIKLYQVNGDCDWAEWDATNTYKTPTCKPTTSQTVTRADVLGDDVPVAFEHNGELIVTFGDTIGAAGYSAWTNVQNSFGWGAHDPIARSTTANAADGLLLNFFLNGNHGLEVLPPPQPDGTPVAMGIDDIPHTGVSLNGTIYLGIKTGNVNLGGGTNDQSHDYSVLATFDETTQTFTSGRTLSTLPDGHFVGPAFYLAPAGVLGTPPPVSPEPVMLIFGVGAFRASNIYLSLVPSTEFASGVDQNGNAAPRYFSGMSNGQPTWSASESSAAPVVTDLDPANPTIGNVSVFYSPPLGRWLMMYDGGRGSLSTEGIYFTSAPEPWGPWSTPQLAFNACRDKGFGNFIFYYYATAAQNNCPGAMPAGVTSAPNSAGPAGPTIGDQTANDPNTTQGATYAPALVERFTIISGSTLKLFYMFSTWNPYAVVMMESDFNIASTTTTTLTSSVNPATLGQSVTLTATVTPAAATGTLTFKDGATTLGTIALNGGTATLVLSTLAAGAHSITAVYSGDTNDAGSTSSVLTLTVNQPVVTGPAITSISPPSVNAGSPSVTVTITGTGFVSDSGALWNGLSLVTTFVSSTTLRVQIPANDLVSQGIGQITVANPTGPASNSVPFIVSSALSLQLLTVAPCRVMDTRNSNGTFGGPFIAAGSSRAIPIPSSACGVPASAAAYSLNFTVVPRTGKVGSLTVWPTSQTQPNVSTLTSPDGSVLAAAAIVPAGAAGSINASSTDDTDLVVDINGYFVPPATGALEFYPLPPCRVLDTRLISNGGSFPPNSTFGSPSLSGVSGRSFPIPSSSCGAPVKAAAYSLNVTVVPQGPLGYVTAWPTGQTQPFVSTINSYDGTVLANAAIVPAGAGGAVSFFASNLTDLVVDINGYFGPPGSGGLNFYTVTPCRLVDTRNANGNFGGPTMGAGTTRNFPLPQGSCGLPNYPVVEAYSLSMTVFPQGGPLGYLSIWPTGGAQPFVSTLNAYKGLAVANAALVPAGTGGAISVFATNTTDLTIDTAGYFGP